VRPHFLDCDWHARALLSPATSPRVVHPRSSATSLEGQCSVPERERLIVLWRAPFSFISRESMRHGLPNYTLTTNFFYINFFERIIIRNYIWIQIQPCQIYIAKQKYNE
jgi:hypothetical protein